IEASEALENLVATSHAAAANNGGVDATRDRMIQLLSGLSDAQEHESVRLKEENSKLKSEIEELRATRASDTPAPPPPPQPPAASEKVVPLRPARVDATVGFYKFYNAGGAVCAPYFGVDPVTGKAR